MYHVTRPACTVAIIPTGHDSWESTIANQKLGSQLDMDVSKIEVSIRNHPFWGTTIFENTQKYLYFLIYIYLYIGQTF